MSGKGRTGKEKHPDGPGFLKMGVWPLTESHRIEGGGDDSLWTVRSFLSVQERFIPEFILFKEQTP